MTKRSGKARLDEGTSSISLQSQIEKKIEPKKNIATPKNDARVVKDKGQKTTPPLKKNEMSRLDNSSGYVRSFNGYCFSCTKFGHMARDCKVVDMYNYQRPTPLNESSRYTRSFNGYCFLCNNYGDMARDCEVFGRYHYHLQSPRSMCAGSRDRFHDGFVSRVCEPNGLNIEFFKCHNYAHIACDCSYQLESSMDDIECFKCHNYGHVARACKYNLDNECYKCHNYVHIARDCGYEKVWRRNLGIGRSIR